MGKGVFVALLTPGEGFFSFVTPTKVLVVTRKFGWLGWGLAAPGFLVAPGWVRVDQWVLMVSGALFWAKGPG